MPHDLAALFGAGLLTFLSPCVLPLVPLYLGLLTGTAVAELRAGRGGRRVVLGAAMFALGLSSVFVALGLAASAAGQALVDHRTLLLRVGGVLVIAAGLRFLGLLRLPWLERERRPLLERLRGGGTLAGAFTFGAAFAIGWTPCVGPVLGSALAYTATSGASPLRGALDLAAYAAGLSLPLVAVAAAAPRALRLLARVKRHLGVLERATGAVLVVAGLLLVTDRLDAVVPAAAPRVAAAPCPETADSCEPELDGAAEAAPLAVDRPTLLMFSTPTCPACRRMLPLLRRARDLCTGPAAVRHVDLSDDAGRELARRYRVRGVPTFVFLDADGDEIARLAGEQPLGALTAPLEAQTGQECPL